MFLKGATMILKGSSKYTEGLKKRTTCLNANLCRKLDIFIM